MKAYNKVTGRISSIISIDFEHNTVLLKSEDNTEDTGNVKNLFPSRENASIDNLIIMRETNITIGCEECEEEIELYECDVIKIEYRDYITNENREAYGIIAFDEIHGISLDFPQYETTISLNDEEIISIVYLGSSFDSDTMKEIKDDKLIEIIKEWKSEEIKECAKILQFSK